MMSAFFINRPIFAWVLAIIVMLAGALAITKLPVEQYPNISSPTVEIRANYPGASAQTVENNVTQLIEQQLTGIDNLRYFTASSEDARASISLTFEPGTDPDIAQVQTQNKLQSAMPQLPMEVQQQGVRVQKSNSGFLMVAGFYAENGSLTQEDIGDIVSSSVRDTVARVNGVGSVQVFGEPHAMRIWLDPHKLRIYNLTTLDIRNAIEAQNTDVSAGQLGGMPAVPGQQLNAAVTVQSRLTSVTDFERILLRVNPDGSQLRLQDVARVELGAETYNRIARYRGQPASGMAINLASGANALQTANAVKAKISELLKTLPPGVNVVYPYDSAPFISLSIKQVVTTLFEAIGLVFLVMLLFLQNFRATLIPTIAVPVVLLGTFGILYVFGFSINVLTMFAMVLAIGLLVDDAIVVVENVERLMREKGLSPKEATRESMGRITGALVGIALVLSAVFVPMAFFSGSVGGIYRQFSITIVSAMTLSVLVALVLSPSLCATLLKPINQQHKPRGFSGWFNRYFNKSRQFYKRGAKGVAQRTGRSLLVYLAVLGLMTFLFVRIPSAFLPNEDQGIMLMMVTAPPGATAERTRKSAVQVENYFLENEEEQIDHLFTVTGFSFAGVAQNVAIGFVGLKDWDERKNEDQSVFAISGRAMAAFAKIKDALAYAFFPPPIRDLGNASGFSLHLIDRGGQGHNALMDARNQLLGLAAKNPKLAGVRPNGLNDVPQFKVDIDTEKAAALGLSLEDINRTLQTAWGAAYVNDFIDAERIKRVYMQADAPFRMLPEDLNSWYVRNTEGEMVPFSVFSQGRWTYGSPKLERFSGVSSVNIMGQPAPGVSSGEAMAEIESLIQEQLPRGFDLAWAGLSYEEKLSGSQAPLLYALSILAVFLCLAALYESWTIPFAVLLVIPLGVTGALISASLFGLNNDVYFQVALLTTVGLSAKNAILIVEFARRLYDDGHDLMEATLMAAGQRFRPIIMTSFAFILGVTPLAISTGAGSESQNAIGIGVMGGMFAATFIAIFFAPLFYILVEKLSGRKRAISPHSRKAASLEELS